jgi:TMEM175 potassium channel family protein
VKETGRVEAFSDGVFAIATTLLVLDLKVPTTSPLLQSLLLEWPVFVAYIISFSFILIMWINHHWMFQHIVRVDTTFMLLNGLLLLGITVVPFPTNLVAEYVLTPDQTTAAAIYNGWFFMIAIFFNLMWRYAAHNGRLLSERDAHAGLAEVLTRRYSWGPVSYFVAFALAFVWVPASLGVNVLLAVYYAIPRERIVRLPGRRASPSQ